MNGQLGTPLWLNKEVRGTFRGFMGAGRAVLKSNIREFGLQSKGSTATASLKRPNGRSLFPFYRKRSI